MKIVLNRIWYTLLTLIVLILLVVFFFLNSTKTIEWVANTYAPQYGFGYKQISGGLLTGFEVEELTYKNASLVDTLKLGWNPASILYKKVSITHLEASGVNIDSIKKVVDTFTPTTSNKERSSLELPFNVGIGDFNVTVKPFNESGIGFKTISLDGEGIFYYGTGVNIDDLSLFIDSNITNIELSGEVKEKKVRIKKLNIVDVDTIAIDDVIETMIAMKIDREIVEIVEPEIDDYKAGRENFLPKSVRVDSAILTLKAADYPEVKLNRGEVNVTSLEVDFYGMIDIHPDTVQVANLSVLLDSDLSIFSIDSRLENETVTVESLSVRDIDTIALKKFLESFENNETTAVSKEEPIADNRVSTLLPKYLFVKHMDSSIKSATYEPLYIESAEVNAMNVKFNLTTFIAESGEVGIRAASNFVSLSQHGVIDNNHINNKGKVTANKALFETYGLPQEEAVFDPMEIDIEVDKKQITVDFALKTENILQPHNGALVVEYLSLKNHLVYLTSEGQMKIENEGNISTPYAKELYLENVLILEEGEVNYNGKIMPGKLENLDSNYTKFLNDTLITYKGDGKSVEAMLDSEGLKGKIISADLKTGNLNLSTKQPLELKNMFSLPKTLESSKVAVDVHVPFDLRNILPLTANAKFTSNLATVDADIFYDKELKVRSRTIFPEDSLLRRFDPKLNLDALSPLEADLVMDKRSLQVDLRSKGLSSQVNLYTENKNLDGNMVLGGAEFLFKGNLEKELSLENSVSSLEGLLHKVSTIYAFDVPPLDGDAKISLVLKDMKDVVLKLNSNTLMYNKDHIINDTMISLRYSDSNLTLNSYHTTFDTQKFFATKPSVIMLKEGKIEVSPLWINDELKVTGLYDIKTQKGETLAFADTLNIAHEMGELTSRVDIKSRSKGEQTTVEGTISILGGNIYYDINKNSFASDKDIIVVQEMKKEKPSPFMDNLTASIKVHTVDPLLYKTDEADVKVNADVFLKKDVKGPLSVHGEVEILKGSSYRVENKKFVFKKSIIEFTGNPNEPILDISAGYKAVKAEINIQIAGSMAAPDIVISSIPYMSKDEIISMILFDSGEDESEYSEEEKLKMMDGKIVQSVLTNSVGSVGGAINTAFSTIGINIDALPFIGKPNDINKTKKAFFTFFSKEDESGIPSHEIKFTGQEHLKENDLQKAMAVDTKSIIQFWKEDRPTIKDKLLPTLEESLQNFYISEGFYDAKFSIKTSKKNVSVKIDENKPIKISDIKTDSDYDIADLITFEKMDIFKAKEFKKIKRDITQRLLNDGYCNYNLDSKAYVDKVKHEANIDFTLKKGDVCTFGKVTVKGLETINDSVLLSRVRTREGERFSMKLIQETYDELYGLGAFDSVTLKYDKKSHNVVPIEIEGKDISSPYYFKGGLGYDTSTGFRISADAVRTNFMGNAKQIGLHLTYSNIEQYAELSYFIPAEFHFQGYYIDLTSKVGYSKFKYNGFTEYKSYAQATLDYNDEKLSVTAGVALENIDISSTFNDKYIPIHPISSGTFFLAGPFLKFSYDARDSKLDPKYGYYMAGKVEYALPYDSGASSYLKYGLEGRVIHTFSNLTLSAVGKAGSVEQEQNDIPESKFFFAGGIDSNRAYGYKRVGVILSPTTYGIAGGSTMANLSLEANYPLWEQLYGAVFTDNTILTKESHDFSGDVLSSAGAGVRYITPIGPLKVDVGMNVNDPSQYALWFHIGQSF